MKHLAACVVAIFAVATSACSGNVSKDAGAPAEETWHVATGALDGDCNNSGVNPDKSVQFIVPCPQSARSPDGQWTMVQTKARVLEGDEEIYRVYIADATGRIVGDVPDLTDSMPFVLKWSPRQNWFLVNHWRGSGLERPRVFEITQDRVVEHARHLREAETRLHEMFPCLPGRRQSTWVTGTGLRWSRNGSHVAWIFHTRPDTCYVEGKLDGPQWEPVLMSSDARTGRVEPDSVRVLNKPLAAFPFNDPSYANY